MPTYRYKRLDGKEFEVFQKITDRPLTICPNTGQKCQIIITGGSGVQFKGTGFYETDYKGK